MVRTKKRTLIAIAAAALLCMLAALVCFFMPAWKTAYAEETTVSNGEELVQAMHQANEGDIIKLSKTFTIDMTKASEAMGTSANGFLTLAPKDSQSDDGIGNGLTIDLNGKTLTVKTGSENCCFNVQGVTITFKNGSLKGESKGLFINGDENSAVKFDGVKLTFTYKGAETGNCAISTKGTIDCKNTVITLSNVAKEFDVPEGKLTTDDTLQSKILLANKGDTITLDRNYEENITIPSHKELTIDLNGFKISCVSSYAITNNGTLTLKDGTIEGDTRGISSSSTANTTLINCTVSGTDRGIYLYKGSFKAENSTISGGNYGLYVSGATVNVTGGTISAATTEEKKSVNALKGFGEGINVTLDGTELKTDASTAANEDSIEFNDGTLTLKNVTANGDITLYTSADVTIESGTYTLEMIEARGDAALSIKGGTFVSENIVKCFDSSWLVDEDVIYALRSTGTNGTYIVNEYNNNDTDAVCIGGDVALVDGAKYGSISEALSAAAGKTLTLLTNIKEALTISSMMTLDLGVYSITAADGTAITVNSGATLTIKGSGTVAGGDYGQAIANNGTVVLQGGTYEQAIELDWIDGKYALSVENVSKEPEYTVTDEVIASITRGEKTYNFASLYTVFTKNLIQSGETIVLQADHAGSVILGSDKQDNTYTLDLNGHVLNGTINLYSGTLNIENTATEKAAIEQEGNTIQILPDSGKTAKVTLGENIEVRSETGAAVFMQTKASAPSGDTFTPYAILESKADLYSRDSVALAGNGSNHCTEIKISGGSVITDGDAPAIYHPQYGTLTIENAEVRGATGIEMRAGHLTVSGESLIEATASAFEETPNGSGSTMTGVAVAVSQHTTNLPVSVTIESGMLKGVKAVYEKDLQDGTTDNITLSLTGGTFEGEVESENATGFISGGSFVNIVDDELLAANKLMVFENGQYSVLESSGEAAENIVITVGKVGYTSEGDAQKAGVVVKIKKEGAPAEGYLSLAEAVAAVPANDTETTITFLGGEGTTVSAPGVKVNDGQNIVIDFNGITFDVTDTVGSAGTETNGFQLLKDATVVMKNGTLTSKTAKILIQQYCNLTVEDMKLDMSDCPQVQYVISNNHGTTTITGNTTIVAAPNQVAFDVYYGLSATYADGVTVVFDENFTGSVEGKVEYGAGGAQTEGWTEKAKLEIENGTFDITFSVSVVEETEASVSISGGSFVNVPAAEYIANASALYTDGTKYAVAGEGSAPSGMSKVIFVDSDGKGYASIAAAAGVETLYLYLDLDALTVNAGEEAVIDLNGKNVSTFTNNGTLTIKGMGYVTAVENNGTLTVNSGYYDSLTGSGTVNYNGGYFKNEVTAPEGFVCVNLTDLGESFDGDYNSTYPYAVYRQGEVTVSGSEFTLPESGSIDFNALAYDGAQFTYSYAEAENGEFTGGLPKAAGTWYIKAKLTSSRLFADENGNKVCYPAEAVFEVTVKARPDNVTAPVIKGEYCVGTALSEIALPTAENGTWAWKDETLTVGDTAGMKQFIAVFTPNDTTLGKVEMEVSLTVVAHNAVTVPGYAATCTTAGLTNGSKCSVCGKTLQVQTVIPELGHSLVHHAAKAPTCTEAGWNAYDTCTRCSYTTYREIPAAHTPQDAVRENEKAPTCTEAGSYDEVVYCSVCKEELSRKTVTVEATGHAWGEWDTTKAPTCTAEGEEQRVCANDPSHVEKRALEKAAHTPVTVEGKEATCTEEGLTDGEKCSVCGETFKEQETIPALGHDFGEWTADEDAGEETRTCSRCGETETRALPEEAFPVWGIVLICVGGVVVVGGVVAAVVIVRKKRA